MGRPMAAELEDATQSAGDNATGAIARVTAAAETSEIVTRSNLQRETSALSSNIIRIITSGNWENLKPNTGNSVEVGNHHVCVSYDAESNAEYRTWEWQGHILLYDEEENMYVLEHVYGNYFEPLLRTEHPYENFLVRPPYGLSDIINNIERRINRTS